MGQLFADAARAYLSAGIAAGDTTISISSGGALFPVANGTDWFKAVLQDASGIEIVYVTAHTSGATSFTVTRGQEGTTARPFAAGAVFGVRVTATDMVGFAAKVADAPSDGKTYGRKNAAWAEVVSGGATYRIGDVQIAPTAPATGTWLLCDGSVYLQSSYASLYSSLGLIANNPGQVSAFTARTMPSSANWGAIAYGNGVFVATTNNGTGDAASSTNGTTWTARTMTGSLQIQGITYGAGIFVAVGLSSGGSATTTAVTSTDGITWTSRTLPSSATWRAVAYGGGVFVAIANGGTVAASSTDGINWTARTLPSSSNWRGVAYGGGVFVATSVASSTAAAISYDGATWTAVTLPTAGNYNCIAYGNGIFVTLAAGTGAALTSQDGISWTNRTLPTTAQWNAVSFGGGTFMAVSQTSGNTCITSSDGAVWITKTLPATGTYYGVAYGNKLFVTAALSSTSAASAYAGISYNAATQFAVPRAISQDINSWVRAL